MIQQQTILKVTDNSGAKTAKCIKVLGGFKRKFAYLGDIIVVSIQKIKNFSKIKKGDIYKALIVRTKRKINRNDGSFYFLFENAVSLFDKRKHGKHGKTLIPAAGRLFGPVSKKLITKFSDFTKVANEIF